MNSTLVIVAAIGALGTSLGGAIAWLIARRQTSGKIDTSDAATLWAASEELRKELREEVLMLRAQAVDLLRRIDRLEGRLSKYEFPGGEERIR